MAVDLKVDSFEFIVQREPNIDWHIDSLAHKETFVIAFCLSGLCHYVVEGRKFTASEGDAVWFLPGCEHTAYSDPDEPWKFCSVGFHLSGINNETAIALRGLPNKIRVLNYFRITALLEELVHEWAGKRIAYLIRCRSIVEEILFNVIRSTDEEEQRRTVPHVHLIRQTAKFIEDNPESSFSVADLAKKTGLSVPYFRRLFKQVSGHTPIQYQHWVKINKAKDLLLSGECNVSETAFQLGFDNVYYFSRLFKQVARVNPSEFLRR